MSEEREGTVPLTAPSIDPEKLLNFLSRIDGVTYSVISREGLPVYMHGVEREQAEALAALGEDAFRRLEEAFGKLGGGKVMKVGVDVAKGRLYVSRLDGGVIIYQALPGVAEVIASIIDALRENKPIKCSSCNADLTLAVYRCPKCGKTVPFVARTCPHCGANIDVKRCPQCGTLVRSDGSIVTVPKAPLALGFAGAAIMLGIAGYAALTGFIAAAAASGVGGLILAVGTALVAKKTV